MQHESPNRHTVGDGGFSFVPKQDLDFRGIDKPLHVQPVESASASGLIRGMKIGIPVSLALWGLIFLVGWKLI